MFPLRPILLLSFGKLATSCHLLIVYGITEQVGEQWKSEMKDLTVKFEQRLREAQTRNKLLRSRLEKVKVR